MNYFFKKEVRVNLYPLLREMNQVADDNGVWTMRNPGFVEPGPCVYKGYYDKQFYAVMCVESPVANGRYGGSEYKNINVVPVILAKYHNYRDAESKCLDSYNKYRSHIVAENNLFVEKVKNICNANSQPLLN